MDIHVFIDHILVFIFAFSSEIDTLNINIQYSNPDWVFFEFQQIGILTLVNNIIIETIHYLSL